MWIVDELVEIFSQLGYSGRLGRVERRKFRCPTKQKKIFDDRHQRPTSEIPAISLYSNPVKLR